jgi:IS30 family transposase
MSKQIKWDRVEEIRKLAGQGLSYREIAKELGIHYSTVCRDFHRKKRSYKVVDNSAFDNVAL